MNKRTAIFISHATPEGNDFTLWLGAKLSAMDFEVWADVLRLRGGDDWARKLEDGLRNRAKKVLLVADSSRIGIVRFASSSGNQHWAMRRENLSPAYTTRWSHLPCVK